MNSLIWKGVSSTTIEGLLISELPPITKPQMRVKETVIDGRDGSIFDELGYSAYDKKVSIGLHGNFDINRVIKYFTGEGEVVFSNEPDKIYKAKIIDKIDYDRLLRYRKAVIPFRVQPYKYKFNEAMKETQTATASGTNIVLKDSGKAPMQITTEAESVVVHGKNLINANAMVLHTSTSIDIKENGYTIVVKGGTKSTYTSTRYYIPLHTRGKQYTLKCDDVTSEQNVAFSVQIVATTPSGVKYFGCGLTNKSVDFTMPSDATDIFLGIFVNNTNAPLVEDNTVKVTGLRLFPIECKADAWCESSPIQTIDIVDGKASASGVELVTVISNADNVAMTVEYYKSFEVFNEGLESSKPLMLLKGSGTVEISVNGTGIFSYTFPDGESEVYIDCEKEDAYLGSTLKNRNMNGEFPTLLPGTNKIEWSGDVESISILPRSRWL